MATAADMVREQQQQEVLGRGGLEQNAVYSAGLKEGLGIKTYKHMPVSLLEIEGSIPTTRCHHHKGPVATSPASRNKGTWIVILGRLEWEKMVFCSLVLNGTPVGSFLPQQQTGPQQLGRADLHREGEPQPISHSFLLPSCCMRNCIRLRTFAGKHAPLPSLYWVGWRSSMLLAHYREALSKCQGCACCSCISCDCCITSMRKLSAQGSALLPVVCRMILWLPTSY